MTVILEVKDVVTRFRTSGKTVHAVNGVSFTLNEGEILCVVGESGLWQERHHAVVVASDPAASR